MKTYIYALIMIGLTPFCMAQTSICDGNGFCDKIFNEISNTVLRTEGDESGYGIAFRNMPVIDER